MSVQDAVGTRVWWRPLMKRGRLLCPPPTLQLRQVADRRSEGGLGRALAVEDSPVRFAWRLAKTSHSCPYVAVACSYVRFEGVSFTALGPLPDSVGTQP